MSRARLPGADLRRLIVSGAAFATATACSPGPAGIPVVTEIRGEAVVVTCSVDCAVWGEEASDVAEVAAEVAADLFGVPPRELGRLHLPRDIDEYESIEARTTGGRFRANLAFSESGARLAVVAVQPPVDARVLNESGLPMQTLRLVAHEVSHLASYVAMPPPRRVPSWLEEGVAIHVESETRARTGLVQADIAEDPLLSTYHHRTAAARAADRLPSIANLLADEHGDLDGGEVYAVRAVLFMGMMARYPEGVRRGLEAAISVHLSGEAISAVGSAFIEAYGGADRIDEAFAAQLARVEPKWHERSRSLETAGPLWEQHPFPDRPAHSVRVARSGPPWTLMTDVLLAGDDPVAAITLRTGDELWGFVRVSREAIEVVRDTPREVLARIAVPDSIAGRSDSRVGEGAGEGAGEQDRVNLILAVDGEVLRVESSFGALEAVTLPTPLDGPWGLLAQGDGWVGWAGLTAVR